MSVFKTFLCYGVAALFIYAGITHFTKDHVYAAIVPPFLPFPFVIVWVTGVMEIILAIGLILPKWRRVSGQLFAPYLLAVLPANIYMALAGIGFDGVALTPTQLWIRVALQFPLIALILWASGGLKKLGLII